MLKTKKMLVLIFVALLSFSVISSVLSNSENSNIIEPLTTKSEDLPVKTAQDQTFLKETNMIIKTPTTKAAFSESEAIKYASLYAVEGAQSATGITTEYQLLTNKSFRLFSESAKAKNKQINSDGYLNSTPVYIVTFKGLNLPSSGGNAYGIPTKHYIFHENNVDVDANSGEVLYSYSYQ